MTNTRTEPRPTVEQALDARIERACADIDAVLARLREDARKLIEGGPDE